MISKQKITEYKEPWTHYVFENFFSDDDYKHLLKISTLHSDYTKITGFRDVIGNRVFLSNQYVNDNPQLKPLVEYLNDKERWKKLALKKLDKNKKQYLDDALMTSIAGISAAMKNTG